MAAEDTTFLKRATLGQLGRFDAMARRRFGDEALAGEAVGFVLDALEADDWRRVRRHRGTARLRTYLRTVAARLLEDCARARFGRVRVPDWVRVRGALWERIYRLLCLERQSPQAAAELATRDAPGGRDPAVVAEALGAIRARYPNCGGHGPEEIPLEDAVGTKAPDGADPLASARTPEDDCLETERLALMRALRDRLLGAEADGSQIAGASNGGASNGGDILSDLPPLALSAEERLLLRLVYLDGLKVTAAGAQLGLGAHQTHGRLAGCTDGCATGSKTPASAWVRRTSREPFSSIRAACVAATFFDASADGATGRRALSVTDGIRRDAAGVLAGTHPGLEREAAMTQSRRDPISERERLAALLALHAAQPARGAPEATGDGPSAAELAALMDGRLSGEERERVLAQLDASPDAYLAWLGAGAEAGDAGSGDARPARTIARRWPALGGMAAAVLAGILVWWGLTPVPPVPLLARQIDDGLVSLSGALAEPPVSFAKLGIVSRGGSDDALAAAVAGYRSGLVALGVLEAPADSGTLADLTGSPGYEVGRWVALLEAGSVVDPPPDRGFWEAQSGVGERLLVKLDAAGAGGSAVAEAVRGFVALLHRGVWDGDWREQLALEVRASRLRIGLDWEAGGG